MTKPADNEQHIYHHSEAPTPKVNVKAEKNSKGWNYEATIVGAESPDEAMRLLKETIKKLEAEFSDPQGG